MAPIKAGKYEYRPESLVRLRKQMGLKQKKMADLLGVPANTLSRWETGATTPDAESLAAIYSIAMERDENPEFFQRRRPAPRPHKGRSRLLVLWDLQDTIAPYNQVEAVVSEIKQELEKRFPNASYRRSKAFGTPYQRAATDELLRLGWRVWEEDEYYIEGEIIKQAKSDCGQEPKDTICVLISKNGGYEDLIEDLKSEGVHVYLLTPWAEPSESLQQKVGKNRYIRLRDE